jgi:hypothetical protein
MKNIQEQIIKVIREETTIKKKLKEIVESNGIIMGVNIIGSISELFSILDIKGSREDMLFLIKVIMDNDVKERLKYCSYNIVPTQYSVNLYVDIPKPLPQHEGNYMYDQRLRGESYELISNLLYKLGDGLIRGHNIYVYNAGNC